VNAENAVLPASGSSAFRRLDHVAIAVRDTGRALEYFCGQLGLEVVHTDVLDSPPLVLTYLDAGNAYVQLIAPRSPASEVARWLDEHGEGLHHICFGVEDVPGVAAALSSSTPDRITLGRGRGRTSAFVPNGSPHGVVVEVTAWEPGNDGDDSQG
jgi:methylmalonyl-CoA/ethylmalonyl-CoA epimerase